MKISPQAIIENGAKIGEGCVIESYAFVGKNAVIEQNCTIKQGARIVGNTKICQNSIIYSYAIIGDICQDISYAKSSGEGCGVVIGKNASIREFCTINSGTHKNDECDGYTLIGDNAFIMAYCHIAHDCRLGDNIILANNATLGGHVRLGDFVVVGGLTPIHQFVEVGEGCMIAGASALSQDIVPFCLAEGNRAYIRGLNLVGLRRRFDKEIVEAINKAYKFLFKGDLKDNARALMEQNPNPQVLKMCEFILKTTRGIPLKKEING